MGWSSRDCPYRGLTPLRRRTTLVVVLPWIVPEEHAWPAELRGIERFGGRRYTPGMTLRCSFVVYRWLRRVQGEYFARVMEEVEGFGRKYLVDATRCAASVAASKAARRAYDEWSPDRSEEWRELLVLSEAGVIASAERRRNPVVVRKGCGGCGRKGKRTVRRTMNLRDVPAA